MSTIATTHPLTTALANAGIALSAVSRPSSVTTDKEGWKHYAWTVCLVRDPDLHPQTLSDPIPYRMGVAHKSATGRPTVPKVEDVVSSMAMDGSACESTFEDWCANFGYGTDSRKALETFLACQASGAELRKFLRSDYAAIVEAAREY